MIPKSGSAAVLGPRTRRLAQGWSWLHRERSPITIFGLLIGPTLAALCGRARSARRRHGRRGAPSTPYLAQFQPNARLASYLPFEWILPKVDVFVTNGGYMAASTRR